MQYIIQHVTKFRYDEPVRESVTELRMQPRSEDNQHCLSFSIDVHPHAEISTYRDYMSNMVHHFDIPALHTELFMKAEAVVEMLPASALPTDPTTFSWEELESRQFGSHWDFLHPSRYAYPTRQLNEFSEALQLDRQADPLTTLHRLNQYIYEHFEYVPLSTHVETTIDETLVAKRGVCQDFTHLMIALGRMAGIPCRYVSGYLYHQQEEHDRSAEDATHAWVEAWLPNLGWIGFDPTNNLLAGDRHIRVAIGRDYADVPPTRGTYKGDAKEHLSVGVRVSLAKSRVNIEDVPLNETSSPPLKREQQDTSAAQQQ